ncbi:EAL domain-containing protein [Bordetella genomosp. 13]|uniref:EAL domain-containing protein n=1 Tax=Bordetella genomosp. 13 TaxID=463040 RepID=UPI0011A17980|nr:EAL domain-containing protein [Bordetella genomosp. 13]
MPRTRIVQLNRAGLSRLASATTLRVMREGMVWTLPCLLVSALMLLLSQAALRLGLSDAAGMLNDAHEQLDAIMPFLVCAAIGYMLALRYRLPQLPCAFLCLAYVGVVHSLLQPHPQAAATLTIFIAIVAPLVNVPLMAWLHRWRWTRLAPADFVDDNVRDTLNMVIPGLLSTALVMAALSLLLRVPAVTDFSIPLELAASAHPYLGGPLIAGVNALLWFFGIHGYHALLPLTQALDEAVRLNAVGALPGDALDYALNSALLGAFVYIGGAGATLSLVAAILVCSRSNSLRVLALAAIPASLFNVNEILLFGLPLILNPRLVVPFVLTPMVNAALALAAVQVGWLAIPSVGLPMTAPLVFNAYLSTGGQWGAVALQLALLALGALIYAPFVLAHERRRKEPVSIPLGSLDTTFTRLEEKSMLYARDPVIDARRKEEAQREEIARIRRIDEHEFYLEFQPQVSVDTGLCTGCEALLRAKGPGRRDEDGSPIELMQWLAEADLICDLDLWVATQAVRQHHAWQAQGFSLPITINITGGTLASARHCERFMAILEQARGQVSVELTENALVDDTDALHKAFARLHGMGARIYLDDFGTGYSALSYLHQFDIDAIKIDRSFIVALDTPRGAQVLAGLLRFCETLDLRVVVEGVETAEQLRALKSSAEIIVQGWYYSKALPAQEIAAFAQGRVQESAMASGKAGRDAGGAATGGAVATARRERT